MSFRIVVLAKQVPDTRNVGKDAMKEDGTINRAVLPAIFNPEDLNALEMALEMKDRIEGAEVVVLTMGPQRACDIIKEAMYRGADGGYLISDMKFAGADTLATSYTISKAIENIKDYNVVISGRQAIDGDTAQVGPQCAEKLNIPQITYAEELLDINTKEVVIKRRLERGTESVKAPFPCLITVHSSAKEARPRNAKRLMKFKCATSQVEIAKKDEETKAWYAQRPYLSITQWSADDLKAEAERLGLSGSPTKVKKIDNVVLAHKEAKVLSSADADVVNLMDELITEHIIG